MDPAPDPCTRCGYVFTNDESADAHGWCSACRARVVRTAGRIALVPAVLLGFGWFWLLLHLDLMESRWIIGLLALGGLLSWVAFKVGRRVSFEVLSAQGRRRHRKRAKAAP
jgi:hypothetical protein